jgi:hypothetical protein
MSPMIRMILVKENTKKQGDYESFLQGRALGPPQISSSYNFEKKKENGERILY